VTADEIACVAVEELPAVIGELARLQSLAMARLLAPAAPETADTLLTAEEAAKRLKVPRATLYKMRDCPFRVRVSAGRVRFSERKLLAYIDRRVR